MPTGDEASAADQQALTSDIGAQRVARVYGEALLNGAEKRGQAEEIGQELTSLIQDVFPADNRLETFLASGVIGRIRKADVIRAVFHNRASELFFNFLMVLNTHERLNLLRPVLVALNQLRDERARRLRVQVQSAIPLEDDQRSRLLRELQEAFGLKPVLLEKTEPELLGGMIVRVGDWVYDASVRTRLEKIRNRILERSSHEIQSGRDRFSSAS